MTPTSKNRAFLILILLFNLPLFASTNYASAHNEAAIQRLISDIELKKQQIYERRAADIQELSHVVASFNEKDQVFYRDISVLSRELAREENIRSKKDRLCEYIHALRSQCEAHCSLGTLLRSIEIHLREELEVERQEEQLKSQLKPRGVSHERLKECTIDFPHEEKRTHSILKTVLTFGAGAACIAFLHWSALITIPQR